MSYAKTPKPEAVRKVTRLTEVTAATVEHAAETAEAEVKSAAHSMQAKMTEAAKTAFEFQRGAIATMIEAGKIYSEGLQTLAAHAAHVNKLHFDETMAALRTLSGTRSINDALKLQAELTRSAATRTLTETTKLVQDYMKVTEQAAAPLTAKVHEAVEMFAKAA
jgi:hypothetical protein